MLQQRLGERKDFAVGAADGASIDHIKFQLPVRVSESAAAITYFVVQGGDEV